jgi:hypothetical protein
VFKKIRVIDGGISNPNYIIYNSSIVFTRLEEIKLLRAEALAVLGQYTQSYAELNAVRGIRDLEAFPVVEDKAVLLNLIFEERVRELMGEGWMWYDLVRFNKILMNNPEMNELINKGGIYWPVSKEVLNSNKQIQQTPYWK